MNCTCCTKCFPAPSTSSTGFTRLSFSCSLVQNISQWTCMCPSTRVLGITIALVLSLAFVERPSSLSTSSDPRQHSARWQPPCGLTESIELFCLLVFSLDLATKVNTAQLKNISMLQYTIRRKKEYIISWKCLKSNGNAAIVMLLYAFFSFFLMWARCHCTGTSSCHAATPRPPALCSLPVTAERATARPRCCCGAAWAPCLSCKTKSDDCGV